MLERNEARRRRSSAGICGVRALDSAFDYPLGARNTAIAALELWNVAHRDRKIGIGQLSSEGRSLMTHKDARRAPRDPERRLYPRKGTLRHALLQTPAGDFECCVVSLSPRGARIEIDHPVAQKQVVTLII